MKIKIKQIKPVQVFFSGLEIGQCFVNNAEIHLKISDALAFNFFHNKIVPPGSATVHPVEAELLYESF